MTLPQSPSLAELQEYIFYFLASWQILGVKVLIFGDALRDDDHLSLALGRWMQGKFVEMTETGDKTGSEVELGVDWNTTWGEIRVGSDIRSGEMI